MAGLTNLLLAAALFICIPATLALVSSPLWQAVLIGLILAALFIIYKLDQRRKHALDSNVRNSIDQRVSELAELAKTDNFSFAVTNSSILLLLLLSGAIGGLLIAAWASHANLAFLVGGILLLGFCTLLISHYLFTLGKPLLTVTRQGIVFRNGALIAWSEIDSITLHNTSVRTYSPNHMLVFNTANKKSGYGKFSLVNLLRLFGLKPRPNIAVVLKSNNEHPEVIYRICHLLWANQRNSSPSRHFSQETP